MNERERAEELAKGLIRRLFRIGEHIDAKVVWEPEKFLTDAMLAFAAECVAEERKRCTDNNKITIKLLKECRDALQCHARHTTKELRERMAAHRKAIEQEPRYMGDDHAAATDPYDCSIKEPK